jgi:type I restriction enzyme S subunit
MTWASTPLYEVFDPAGKHRAGRQDLPVLSITMKYGLVDQADKFKKRVASSDTSNYRIAYKNELVVGFPIDEGVLGFQTKYGAGIVSPAYDVWKLKDEAKCHIPYLERYLRSPQARSLYASRMQGAVARRRSLTKADFLKLEIPLPGLEDQIRIDYLLSKIESLIAQRELHVVRFDELCDSVFLDMFGDPVRNERGWEKKHFSQLLVNIESGKSPKCEARPASENEWGVLKLGSVTKCSYDDRENKALPENVSPSVRDEVKAGDLLFSRKNTYELVAACAYVFETRPKLLMPDLIFRFVFKEDAGVDPIYMWKLLTAKSQRKAIQSLASGAAGSMPNISKANLKEIKVPIPPPQLQEKFSAIVNKVKDLKLGYLQSLADLKSLYGALSQLAYKGKLDLSKVQLPLMPIQGEQFMASADFPEQSCAPMIDLPDSKLLLATLEDRKYLSGLLQEWLEAYRSQIGNAAFSVENFMSAAHSRLLELSPDTDFELSGDAYEHVKRWMFEALDDGRLKQSQNITGFDRDGAPISGNSIEIKNGTQY